MKHNWQKIQGAIDKRVLEGQVIPSIAVVARWFGMPRETVRDAITRGDLNLSGIQTLNVGTNEHHVTVNADEYSGALAELDQMGYDVKDWIVDAVSVGRHQHHTSHKFRLLPRGAEPQMPVLRPVEVNLGPLEGNVSPYHEIYDPDVTFCIPDLHFGYVGDNAIHNETAISELLFVVMVIKPENIILLGDLLDFTEWSDKFLVKPEHVSQTQRGLVALNEFLGKLRQAAPKSRIVALEGNHDARFKNYLMRKLPEAFQLRTNNDQKITDIQTYIDFESLDIEYVDGYPNNETMATPNTVAIHGHRTSVVPGKAADLHFRHEHNVVFGHIHRPQLIWRRGADNKRKFSVCPGTLCKIDGTTPGSAVRNDWFNGFLMIETYDGTDVPVIVPFDEGRFLIP